LQLILHDDALQKTIDLIVDHLWIEGIDGIFWKSFRDVFPHIPVIKRVQVRHHESEHLAPDRELRDVNPTREICVFVEGHVVIEHPSTSAENIVPLFVLHSRPGEKIRFGESVILYVIYEFKSCVVREAERLSSVERIPQIIVLRLQDERSLEFLTGFIQFRTRVAAIRKNYDRHICVLPTQATKATVEKFWAPICRDDADFSHRINFLLAAPARAR